MGGADGVRLRRVLRVRRRGGRHARPLVRRRAGVVRLLNASGCLDALAAPEVARSLDAFVTKTVTPEPRQGNAPPRIAETDHGMLNAIGLANPGREVFLAQTLPLLGELGSSIWVSVGGFSAGDYAETCARLPPDDVACVELNLSCPNVDEAPESAAEIVAACRRETSLQLYAKLSPHAWDIGETVRAVEAAGADGISLVNTLRGLALSSRLAPALARGAGGYSGAALKPVALAAVHAARCATSLPIVGMGGVVSGRDALELVACGANDVALGTVLFVDPDSPIRVRGELEIAAHDAGHASPDDAFGAAHGTVAHSANGR
ncbi:MAG TPA: dihydroorotate dehydrogenase catalytic subunit [Gaiellaceae bacterium]|nr:dihydroorotate dehydrogenase catalytic subunit [Gaiellaceae bacterium]